MLSTRRGIAARIYGHGSAWYGANHALVWDDHGLPADVTVLDVSAVEVSSECVECSIPPLKIAPGLN